MVKKITHTVITAILIAIAVTVIVFQIISLTSCKKHGAEADKKTAAMKAINDMVPGGEFPCELPTVENGILTFTDTTQYLCYENFLTELTTQDSSASGTNATFASMGEDEKLAYVENMLGFQSLRAEKLAAFEVQNARGWATSEEIPDEDWIHSRIRRSMLNTNREVRIGNYIEKHVSPEYMVTVDALKPELLTALRGLPENPAVEDIIALDLNRYYIWITSMIHPYETYPTGEKPTDPEPGSGGIYPGQEPWTLNGTVFQPNPCNAYGRVNFSGFTASRNGVPQKCSYHINYGDGTSSGTATDPDKTSSMGTNQSIVSLFSHQYPQGNYTATITIKSVSPYNSGNTVVKTRLYPINIGVQQLWCTDQYRYKWTSKVINSYTVLEAAIRYESWYTPILSHPRTRVSGWTELHQQDANGYWNRVKSKNNVLRVELHSIMADKDCNAPSGSGGVFGNYNTNAGEEGSNTNRKEMERKPPAYNGEPLRLKKLNGIHSFNYDGLSGSIDHSIIICQ